MYNHILKTGPAWIALSYAAVSLLWIFFSDRTLALFVSDPERLTMIQSIKGMAFVIATTLVLYSMIRLYRQQLDSKRQALEDAETRIVGLFHASSAPEVLLDPESLELQLCNPSAARIFGTQSENDIHVRLTDLWSESTTSLSGVELRLRKDIESALEGDSTEFEWSMSTIKQGSRMHAVQLNPLALDGKTVIRARFSDLDDRHKIEHVLHELGDGLAPHLGGEFFNSLTEVLLDVSGADSCFVARLSDTSQDHIDTVSCRRHGELVENMRLDVTGSPLEPIIRHQQYVYEEKIDGGLSNLTDVGLTTGATMTGMPLFNSAGGLEGMIVAISENLSTEPWIIREALSLAAGRAGAELERMALESSLRHSEVRFRSLIDEASQGIIVHKNMKPLYCNPAFATLFGFTDPSEVLALESIEVLFDESELPRLGRYNALRMQDGSAPANYTFAGVKKDGSRITVDNRVVKVPWNNDSAVCANMFDVTEDTELRRELMENREFMRVVLDSSDHGVVACDSDGRLRIVNRVMEEWHDGSFADVPINDWSSYYNLFETDGVTPLKAKDIPLFRALRGEQVRNFEVMKETRNGLRRLSVTGSALIAPDGRKLGAAISMHDITEKHEAETAIRRVQRLESIGQLTGGIAHDFNNLLGIVKGNLELLLLSAKNDDATSIRIENAIKATDRGAQLTDRLLSFSRLEVRAGEPTDINDAIEEITPILEKALTHVIDVEFRPSADIWLTEINVGDLGDAVLNLAINARDAMPNGGKLTIETSNRTITANDIKTEQDFEEGEYVVLSVSDTGKGIDANLLDKVFEPYFTTKSNNGGTGLGLSMVYAFAHRSRGSVRISSKIDCGTTVSLFLPRTLVSKPKTKDVLESDELPVGDENVLVVDDEKDLCEIAASMLGQLGYCCFKAHDARSALDVLHAHPEIELVISDVIMPGGMDGFDLAREVRATRADLPILLASGFPGQISERDADPELLQHLLAKPYSIERLATAVRRALNEQTKFSATFQSTDRQSSVKTTSYVTSS